MAASRKERSGTGPQTPNPKQIRAQFEWIEIFYCHEDCTELFSADARSADRAL